MTLLARTADRLYWAGRYLERAEDTARVIRAYNDLVVDFPGDVQLSWQPLLAINGLSYADTGGTGETEVMNNLIADRSVPTSIAMSITYARENLRATREVIPREAWQAVNSLSQYANPNAPFAVSRHRRDSFLVRVIDDSRRFDGVIDSTMTRDSAYQLFRLGRLVERAVMTTRVLGVRAAALLAAAAAGEPPISDEVQWMGVLRSVSALQMYQRATAQPIEGQGVVRFLLFNPAFPRAVRACLDEMRSILKQLPHPNMVLAVVESVDRALDDCEPVASDGDLLDDAMDRLQSELSLVDQAINNSYVVTQQQPATPQRVEQ